jgi:PAS domain S-box-containing protein/putative nucleotidyltransferase with HDIG domain
VWVLALSILFQLAAAVIALGLISVTKTRLAWGLLSLALFLMTVRRMVSLYDVMFISPDRALDASQEYVALVISICMLAGVLLIKPLFSEIKQAEKEARATRQKFQIFSEYTYDWEYWLAPDGGFLHITPSCRRFTGYSTDDFYKDPELLTKIVHPDDREDFKEHLKHLQEENHRSVDFRIITKDGDVCWVAHACQPVFGDAGEWLGRRGSNRDITERKQAEEALLKSENDLSESNRRLQATLAGTVKALSAVGEHRDPYTVGHQERVAELACAIADEMGLPPEVCDDIRIASRLHDIGKVEIPSEILSKPGKLTDLEYRMVKVHAQAGADILKEAELSCGVVKMVLEHHERLDGSGYPAGLTSNDICLEARIMAVADVVEAMMLHRPYRSALGLDQALAEIQNNKGILYDPDVVDACLKLFNDKKFAFNGDSAIPA